MKRTGRPREGKLILGMLILIALALDCPPNSFPESAGDSITFKGIVVGIKDGDTLTVRRNKARFNVEVAAVDAPELDQPYGQEAKRMTTALVKNQVVIIRAYGSAREGHLMGEVWLKDHRNLGKELVKAGLARVKRGAVAASDLTRLEADAKDAKRGLWKDSKPGLFKDEEPIPPWEWRQGRRPIGVGTGP